MTLVNKQRERVDGARLRAIARAVMAAEGCHPRAELSIAIGDDEWIEDLNRRYKGRAAPTDVLAFPQEGGPAAGEPLLGDVAISAETAKREAEARGRALMAEVALLLVHGILHLTGWKDGTPSERRRMMRRARGMLEEIAPELA